MTTENKVWCPHTQWNGPEYRHSWSIHVPCGNGKLVRYVENHTKFCEICGEPRPEEPDALTKRKPTVAELEAILNGPPCTIQIKPDGSLTTIAKRPEEPKVLLSECLRNAHIEAIKNTSSDLFRYYALARAAIEWFEENLPESKQRRVWVSDINIWLDEEMEKCK